jgi:hypothetical protein
MHGGISRRRIEKAGSAMATIGSHLTKAALAWGVLTAVMSGTSIPAKAAGNSAQAGGFAQATIVAPISAEELADLDFGTVASNPARGGTIAIPSGGGAARYSGGVRNGCPGSKCPLAHAARFAVSGEANRAYAVSTPRSLRVGGNGPALLVNSIEVRTDSRPGSGPHGMLGEKGGDGFSVGAVLGVPAGLPPAHYRVSIPVTLNYS